MSKIRIEIKRFDIIVDGERTSKFFALARDSNTVVGFIDLRCEGLRSASFRQLYVMPNVRRSGIATELVQECEARARTAGCETIGASLTPDNTNARRFYETLRYFVAHVFDEDGSFIIAKRLQENYVAITDEPKS